jgi:hypothetical protein
MKFSLVPSPLRQLSQREREIAQRKNELRTARRQLRHLSHAVVASPLGWSKHMGVIGKAAKVYWDKQK